MQKFTPTLAATLCAAAMSMSVSQAATPPVKIGVLTDMSGTYASMGGMGSVAAAQLAIDDCLKAECKGIRLSENKVIHYLTWATSDLKLSGLFIARSASTFLSSSIPFLFTRLMN